MLSKKMINLLASLPGFFLNNKNFLKANCPYVCMYVSVVGLRLMGDKPLKQLRGYPFVWQLTHGKVKQKYFKF